MSARVRMIAGESASGKSEQLYTWILEEKHQHPEKSFILIAPEQACSSIERRMIGMNQHLFHEPGFFHLDIIGFGRLAYRILESTGTRLGRPYDEYEKVMMTRLAAIRKEKELTVYQNSVHREGFIDKVKTMLSELLRYGFLPEDLQKLEEEIRRKESARGIDHLLPDKLHDLRLIGEEYLSLSGRDESGYLPEERLKKTAEILEDPTVAIPETDGAVICLDEFVQFSPDQLRILAALNRRADEMVLTLPMDPETVQRLTGADTGKDQGSNGLFQEIQSAYRRLSETVGTRIPMEKAPDNRKQDPEIRHLRDAGLRFPVRPYGGQETGGVTVWETASSLEEIRCVAALIREKVQEGKIRYREIAVLSPDLENTALYARREFQDYGIPVFFDQNQDFSKNPYTEGILSSLEIVARGFLYEDVFQFLKLRLLPGMTAQGVEELENMAIQSGIRGPKAWSRKILPRQRRNEAEPSPEELDRTSRMEEVRQQMMAALEPLQSCPSGGKASVYLQAVRDLTDEKHLNYPVQIRKTAEREAAAGRPDLAAAYQALYQKLMDMLAETEKILGNTEMTFAEFEEILSAGFSALSLEMIPPTLDAVTFGDLKRTKLSGVRMLFIVSLNDGVFPSPFDNGKYLSDRDQEHIREVLPEVFPDKYLVFTESDHQADEIFALHQMMAEPSEQLILSWHDSNREGDSTRPSFLIRRILNCFPGRTSRKTYLKDLTGGKIRDALKYMETERALTEPDLSAEKREEKLFFLARYQTASDRFRKGEDIRYLTDRHSPDPLPAEVVKNLNIQLSVSRLERYASCPYAFYLNYLLGIRPRRGHEVDSLDVGTVVHAGMEKTFREIQKKASESVSPELTGLEKIRQEEEFWRQFSPEAAEDIAGRCFEEAWQETKEAEGKGNGSPESGEEDGLKKEVLDRLKTMTRQSTRISLEQIQAGDFHPAWIEQPFTAQMTALGPDGREVPIRINGKIDRVDVYAGQEETVFVRILDYKTGDKHMDPREIQTGTSIQLIVYMDLFLKELSRKLKKRVVPAGVYYDVLSQKVLQLKTETHSEEETIQAAIREQEKNFRLRGISNDDPESGEVPEKHGNLNLQERGIVTEKGLQKGRVIPVDPAPKKDQTKTFSTATMVLSGEEIHRLGAKCLQEAGKRAEEILAGQIRRYPVHYEEKSSVCAYCDYREICRFDPVEEKEHFVRKSSVSAGEMLKRMVGDGKGNDRDKME